MPYSNGISEDVYEELFKDLGYQEERIQKYFSCRATRLSRAPVIAFDSTTISTYSECQSEARHGFNKDHDGLPSIKLLTIRGRQMVQFISICYRCFLMKRIKEVENTLAHDTSTLTNAQAEAERKLKTWIQQSSLVQILDWFDCVDKVTVKTESGKRPWTTEQIERDKEFLVRLGGVK